jgi:hypothetical protein
VVFDVVGGVAHYCCCCCMLIVNIMQLLVVVHVFDCEIPISVLCTRLPKGGSKNRDSEFGLTDFDRIPFGKKHSTAKLKGESGISHPDFRIPLREK